MAAPAQIQAKHLLPGLKLPHERTVRIVTGCVLFAYAASHFLSHATGMCGLEAMERVGRGIILAPWRTYVGQTILFGSLFTHGTLGLKALVRRRHLRMPPIEAVQLGLGLLIPLLLIPHAANVRLGSALFGLDDSYYRLVYQYWITTGPTGLPRQFVLMLAVWIHGCIGLHMYLRLRGWYRRRLAWFASAAILIPFLGILGINNAGWYTSTRAATVPGFSAPARVSRQDGAAELSGTSARRGAARLHGARGEPLGRHPAYLDLRRAGALLDLPGAHHARRGGAAAAVGPRAGDP
jgi:adenylate cyclase